MSLSDICDQLISCRSLFHIHIYKYERLCSTGLTNLNCTQTFTFVSVCKNIMLYHLKYKSEKLILCIILKPWFQYFLCFCVFVVISDSGTRPISVDLQLNDGGESQDVPDNIQVMCTSVAYIIKFLNFISHHSWFSLYYIDDI